MSGRPVVALVTDTVHPYSFGGREIRYHELSRQPALDAEVHIYTMHWWDGPRVVGDGPVTLHAIMRNRPLYRGAGARSGRRSGSRWPAWCCCAAGSTC